MALPGEAIINSRTRTFHSSLSPHLISFLPKKTNRSASIHGAPNERFFTISSLRDGSNRQLFRAVLAYNDSRGHFIFTLGCHQLRHPSFSSSQPHLQNLRRDIPLRKSLL